MSARVNFLFEDISGYLCIPELCAGRRDCHKTLLKNSLKSFFACGAVRGTCCRVRVQAGRWDE